MRAQTQLRISHTSFNESPLQSALEWACNLQDVAKLWDTIQVSDCGIDQRAAAI